MFVCVEDGGWLKNKLFIIVHWFLHYRALLCWHAGAVPA